MGRSGGGDGSRGNGEVSGPQGPLHPAGWEIGMTRWRLVVAELQNQALSWHVPCGVANCLNLIRSCVICKFLVVAVLLYLRGPTWIRDMDLSGTSQRNTPHPRNPCRVHHSTRTCMTQLGYRD